MTKPWEETWSVEPGRERIVFRAEDETTDYAGMYWQMMPFDRDDPPKEESAARACLAACAPEMYRMLVEVEWKGEGDNTICVVCGGVRKHGGHLADCELNSLLKRARGEP